MPAAAAALGSLGLILPARHGGAALSRRHPCTLLLQVLIHKNFKDMPADEITVEFWMRSTGAP